MINDCFLIIFGKVCLSGILLILRDKLLWTSYQASYVFYKLRPSLLEPDKIPQHQEEMFPNELLLIDDFEVLCE